MRRFIQKLRQKPKSTRRKIAFGASASITGVIFAVWLTVLVAGGGVTGETAGQTQTASPLGALESNANSALSEVRDQLSASVATNGTTTASSSQASTNTAPTINEEDNTTEPADDRSYWETRGEPEDKEDASDQDTQESTPPPSQAGNDFWEDSSEADKEGGWFK